MKGTETKPLGLETRLIRLESIVAALEHEELELEEALRIFEEGIGHIRATREILATAELQIEKLLDEAEGKEAIEPEEVGLDR